MSCMSELEFYVVHVLSPPESDLEPPSPSPSSSPVSSPTSSPVDNGGGSSSGGSGGLPIAAVVGGVIGGLAVLILVVVIIIIVMCVLKRRKSAHVEVHEYDYVRPPQLPPGRTNDIAMKDSPAYGASSTHTCFNMEENEAYIPITSSSGGNDATYANAD